MTACRQPTAVRGTGRLVGNHPSMGEDILPGDFADDLVVEERNGTLFDYADDRQAEAAGSAVKLGLHNAVRHRALQDSM